MVWKTSPKRPAQASLAAFGTWRRVETRRGDGVGGGGSSRERGGDGEARAGAGHEGGAAEMAGIDDADGGAEAPGDGN